MPSFAAADPLYARAVADLKWLQQSLPIVRTHPDTIDFQGLLQLPDALTPALRKAMHQGALRLGRYCELLLEWGLQANPAVARLHCGQIVRLAGRTLGEFDFLLGCEPGHRLHHLELAVKFYLGFGALEQPSHWLGLNPRDRLDLKLNRMRDHQTTLGHQPEVQSWLAKRQWLLQSTQGLMLGRLFFPFGPNWQTRPGPNGVNPMLPRGWWCYANQLDKLTELTESDFVLLPRLRRLADIGATVTPAVPLEQTPLARIAELAQQRAVMVSRRVDRHGQLQELDRGVIVPDQWPGALNPASV